MNFNNNLYLGGLLHRLVVLLGLSLTLGILIVPKPSVEAANPWILVLDVEKGLSYFNERGQQIYRSKLSSPSNVNEWIDFEFGNFITDNGWFEIVVLRERFWMEVFPLPRPGEPNVRRYSFSRFQLTSGMEPMSLSLANRLDGSGDLAMYIPARSENSTVMEGGALYSYVNPDEPTQQRISSLRMFWPDVHGRILATQMGLNCSRANFLLLTDRNELWLGRIDNDSKVDWMVKELSLPDGVEVVKMRLVADRLFVLDKNKRIHTWEWQGNELKVARRPVRLQIPVDIISFTPVAR